MDSDLNVRPQAQCRECGFDWDEASYEVLVGQCVHNSRSSAACCHESTRRKRSNRDCGPRPLRVAHRRRPALRNGAVWTISADPTFGVPTWDENVVAEVRSYDQLSPIVGLIALISATDAWRTAAFEAPHDVTTPHPEAGSICAFDVVQRNAHEVCHHLWDVQRAIGIATDGPVG